jgi:hypothetical protein
LHDDKKLDNPVWHSLNETHQRFSINYNSLKCYKPDYCPFGGYKTNSGIAEDIDNYAKVTDGFFIVGDKPDLPQSVTLRKELVCLQMVIKRKIGLKIEEEILHLNNLYDHELLEIVNLVQPGYFKSKTSLLGDY